MNALLLTLALLHGGDSATTTHLLMRGGYETNPLLPQQPALNAVVRGSEAAATIYGIHRISATHPRIARVIAIAGIAVEGYAVARNIHTITRYTK